MNRKNGKKTLMSTFFRTLFISMLVFSLLAVGLYWGYTRFIEPASNTPTAGLKQPSNALQNLFDPVPDRVNFAVLGTDEAATRTDFIIVASYEPKEGRLHLVSIPRDTKITMPKERLDIVKQTNPYVASDGVMKMTEVHHHAGMGSDNGIDFTVKQLEELLHVDLDYYAEINLEGFRVLVDAIGGVTYDVPQRMIHDDPKIDLYPGVQLLDGASAEGLVRFRYGYANGDFDRMNTQQQFIKTMIAQMVAKENVTKSVVPLATTLFQYIKTNATVADISKFAPYIGKFSTDNMFVYTLPTTFKKIRGKDFQLLDEEGTRLIIEQAFFTPEQLAAADASSLNKNIQVLNGTTTPGLASKAKEALEAKGFTVSSISDFHGTKEAYTRIVVAREGQGNDLVPLFTGSILSVDPTTTGNYDIVIILGKPSTGTE